MSVVQELFYGIKCDRCNKICEGHDYQFWADEDSAQENAMDADWHKTDEGKHYCHECHHIDYEDNVIIHEPIVKHNG